MNIFRDDMTRAAVVTVLAGMVAQVYAVYYLTRAALRGVVSLRPQMAVNAALAAMYFIASLWLVLSDYDQVTWSTVMVGVSLIVWIVAWAGPAKWSLDKQAEWEQRTEASEEMSDER